VWRFIPELFEVMEVLSGLSSAASQPTRVFRMNIVRPSQRCWRRLSLRHRRSAANLGGGAAITARTWSLLAVMQFCHLSDATCNDHFHTRCAR
jgi:hypothetical protein